MLSFRHFRERTPRFQPRTPAAAMRAVGAGFAEVEELVYQGTGVRPLIEEPYDLMELQRVLARSGFDLEMCLLLVQIFGKMLHDADPERALFAAEGITTIEARYSKRVEDLKKRLKGGEQGARKELALRSYELALLSEKVPAVRAFYLREAFVWLRPLIAAGRLDLDTLTIAVKVLSELELHNQAEAILAQAAEPRNPRVLYLRAKIAFRKKRYDTVSVILRYLRGVADFHDEGTGPVIGQWTPP